MPRRSSPRCSESPERLKIACLDDASMLGILASIFLLEELRQHWGSVGAALGQHEGS